ncbi:MAG TPA: hypothetical protein VGE07_27775 [Herpetosiphonaceae bacterium]
MNEALVIEAAARLLSSLEQQGLLWSAAFVEPRQAAVEVLWRYPERASAMRIIDQAAGDPDAAAPALRQSIQADDYRLAVLGAAGPGGERDGVLIEPADPGRSRAGALERIGQRAGDWPPGLDADALLAGLARKLAGYAGLCLELAPAELEAQLLDWRELFDPGEQAALGAGEPAEMRRWANLRRLADDLGVAERRIGDALALLPPRQARLIRLRRGIGRMGAAESAEDAAAILQLDPARLPALEAAALAALAAALERQTELLFR